MKAKSIHWIFCTLTILSLLVSSSWMAAPYQDASAAPLSTCADITQIPTGECQALQDLYDSTNGPGWTNHSNWFVTTTPCWDWVGVSCAAGTNVTGLNLYGNNLSGILPTSIGNLTALQSMDLASNQITGTLPAELGSLVALASLYLYNNQLQGNIPPALGSLASLARLELWNNQLDGSIPGELGNLSNLTYLSLRLNQLSGSLPAELGNLNQLEELYLAWNQLTGGIPAWMGNMTSLQTLELERNPLGGGIPPELGNLTALEGLALGFDELTGPIPLELGSLSNLNSLGLDYNQLSGEIPVELGNLSSLQGLYLTWNQLSGGIPASLGSLANLTSLNIGNNQLDGNIPASLGNLDNLTTLNLCVNHLDGELPPELSGLANLQSLYIDGNQLSGPIPAWLGSLSQLHTLRVTNNQFSGEIPSALTSLSQISYLDLGYNMLWAQDPALLAWLAVEDPDWHQTQTVPPEDLQASAMNSESVELTWTPIDYTGDTGYYQVSYADTPGGPYTIHGVTSDKSASSYLADQLLPETPYYFIVRTFTAPHDEQQNNLLSDPSLEVSATTLPPGQDVIVDRATGIDQPACGTGANLPCYSVAYGLGMVAEIDDRVIVYPGTYTETISLHPFIDVISQSGPDVTVIDGEGQRGPMVTASNVGITRSTLLEGFTVTGGNSLGISISNASPVISDCIIIDNLGGYGGGIAINQSGADVLIINSQVLSNTASAGGGGIYISESGFEIRNTTIEHNQASSGPGGVGISVGSQGTFIENIVRYNHSENHWGGGIGLGGNSNAEIRDNWIAFNSVQNTIGGGIEVGDTSTFEIVGNLIANNTALGSAGLGVMGGSGLIEGNAIRDNIVIGGENGGINVDNHAQVVILKNWITGNTTPGVRIWDAEARIENNIVIGGGVQTNQLSLSGGIPIETVNNTILGGGGGQGIYIDAAALFTVTNNIVADHYQGIVALGTITPTISYNDLWINTYDYEGRAIGASGISADPDFVDPSNHDYHLDICSWAVDAGLNDGAPVSDIDGDPRPIDGDGDGSAIVDIGADERLSAAAPMPEPGFTFTVIGLTVSFQNTSQDAVSYLWDFGDGTTSTVTNPTHTYAAAGSYAVALTASNINGCSGAYQAEVTTTAGDLTPPDAISDLVATPGMEPLSVELFWTAPGDDGAGGGSAAEYDIRYSNTPITDTTWANATPLVYPFAPKAPGEDETHSVDGLAIGNRWYFAIKTVDDAGNWSELSNVPSVQENGFRPFEDGYTFPNFDGDYLSDYTFEDMVRMFGEEAVCYVVVNGACSPTMEALWWRLNIHYSMRYGHSGGMASTSLRFFKGLDDPADFKPGATSIQDLVLSDARRHIAYNTILSLRDPVGYTQWQSSLDTPADILVHLRAAMSGDLSDPVVLFVSFWNGYRRLVPFALQELTGGVWHVWVYDSNHPGVFPNDNSRQLIIDTVNNSWTYDVGGEIWGGHAYTQRLGLVHLSTFSLPPVAPWTIPLWGIESQDPGATQLWLKGDAHLLVSDSEGRSLGYTDGGYVTEIPGAYFNNPGGGFEPAPEPVYSIPLTSTYTIAPVAPTLADTQEITITQFGPGYVAGIEGITVAPEPRGESTTGSGSLFIPTDGTQVAYTAVDDQQVNLFLTLNEEEQGYYFKIGGADAAFGEKVALAVDKNTRRMLYSCDEAGSGTYDLEIQWGGPDVVRRFYHSGIPIAAGDSHYVDYTAPEGTLVIIIEIDHGSDGTIDETVELLNQAWQIQLPAVLNQKR